MRSLNEVINDNWDLKKTSENRLKHRKKTAFDSETLLFL